ncbi:hypothetical protein PQI23_12630 [Leucobacter sp. USCH14]|uniref:hypothetical protein n=1 Tax=Leucobacter sp. USCH14 TaxID=3024838 RepID=UPI00309661A4
METLIGSALGWLGTLGTFVAYVLMLRGTWSPSTRSYLTLNAVGGLLAAGGALAYGAWPSFASNVVWGVIGAYGLYATFRKRPAVARPDESATPVSVMTVPLPVLPLPQSPWDPSSTAASSIRLPWLPGSDTATAGGESRIAASETKPVAIAA